MAKAIVNTVKMRTIVKNQICANLMSLPVIMESASTNAMSVTVYATAKMVLMKLTVLPGGVITMSLCVVTDPAHTETISVTVTMTVLTAVTSMIVTKIHPTALVALATMISGSVTMAFV